MSARLIGLTGGIAAGKSTVARLFAERGCATVDADAIAREVVAPGSPALAQIAERCGEDVLLADGSLDRALLGRRVFADPSLRRDIEAITHPAIAARSNERFAELFRAGHPLVVYEAALLIEAGRHREMDVLVVVIADDDLRVRRLGERNGLDDEAARARLAAQLPQTEKARLADFVIDNSGEIEQTQRRVVEVWEQISGAVARMG